MRTDILERKEEILQWIAEEKPKVWISQQLKCKQHTLNAYLQKMGIDYQGQQSKKGRVTNCYKSSFEYLGTNKSIKSTTLKEKLIRDGLKQAKCELCGLSEWMGVTLTLELHHKDGDHYNNSLNNLAILCPNCHSIQKIEGHRHT